MLGLCCCCVAVMSHAVVSGCATSGTRLAQPSSFKAGPGDCCTCSQTSKAGLSAHHGA